MSRVNADMLRLRQALEASWQQFPLKSKVKSWKIRDRYTLNDTQPTLDRVALLLSRVKDALGEA